MRTHPRKPQAGRRCPQARQLETAHHAGYAGISLVEMIAHLNATAADKVASAVAAGIAG